MIKHLLFYDGDCGLCDRAVAFVLVHDVRAEFVFAPLQGETAATVLRDLPENKKDIDSLILIENYNTSQARTLTHGKGALRILWLLGGAWRTLGWMAWLPSLPFDLGYRAVARIRHRFFAKVSCFNPNLFKDRFLP